jgi:PilZ domain
MAASSIGMATDFERHACRGQAIMTGNQREERASNRVLFTAPAVIYANGMRHLGLVRDFSVCGIFFYTDFAPHAGSIVQMTIKLTKCGSKTLTCIGKVVRVTHGADGAAVGVAIKAAEFELTTLRTMLKEAQAS